MFRRKTKLKKVLDKRTNYVTFRDFLKSLSHKELHILAEEIIWKEYDGYNGSSCRMEQNHYDLMDRWQKEFYIKAILEVEKSVWFLARYMAICRA